MKGVHTIRKERMRNSSIIQLVITVSIILTIFNLILGHSLISSSSSPPVSSRQRQSDELRSHHLASSKDKHSASEIQSIDSRGDVPYTGNSTSIESDKQWAVDILESSGIKVDQMLFQKLPTWNQMKSLYYPNQDAHPIIHGIDSCQRFQEQVPPKERFISPSGMFNSGTNLLHSLLTQYCDVSGSNSDEDNLNNNTGKSLNSTSTSQQGFLSGIVAWNKHVPHEIRTKQMSVVDDIQPSHILPVYMTKDPWFWMQSMCRHPYDARGFKLPSDPCPSLTQSQQGLLKGTPKYRKVNVIFPYGKRYKSVMYESLIDLWIKWYEEYYNDRKETITTTTAIPQLIIRYEDLLLFPETILTTVCKCAGGKIVNDEKGISIMEESVKIGVHAPPYTGLREAISIFSAIEKDDENDPRLNGLNDEEIQYVKSKLQKTPLMEAFGYTLPK